MLHAYRKSGGVAVPAQIGLVGPERLLRDEPANREQWIAGCGARGLNLANYLEAPVPGTWGPAHRLADYLKISVDGVDTCRIMVRWDAHATQNEAGTIDSAFFTLVDQVIGWAESCFSRTIMTLCHHRWLDNRPIEAPSIEWATGADDAAKAVKYRAQCKAMWLQVANRYKATTKRVAFELYNEPRWPRMDWPEYNQWFLDTAAAIRATGSNNAARTIVYDTTEYAAVYKLANCPVFDADAPLNPHIDDNIVATCHPYFPFDYTHQGSFGHAIGANTYRFGDWVRGAIEMQFRTMRLWSNQTGVPITATEAGVYWRDIFNDASVRNNESDRALYVRCVRDAAERYGIPLWVYGMSSDWGVLNLPNDNTDRDWLPGMRQSLTGYPRTLGFPALPRTLAFIPGAASFTTPLATGASWDPVAQELLLDRDTNWQGYMAITDTKPKAGVRYQISNGGFGFNSAKLTWFNDPANAGTRGADSGNCTPGLTIDYTIPAGTSISNTARLAIAFAKDDENTGSTCLYICERPA